MNIYKTCIDFEEKEEAYLEPDFEEEYIKDEDYYGDLPLLLGDEDDLEAYFQQEFNNRYDFINSDVGC
jgi:hypothetical protein